MPLGFTSRPLMTGTENKFIPFNESASKHITIKPKESPSGSLESRDRLSAGRCIEFPSKIELSGEICGFTVKTIQLTLQRNVSPLQTLFRERPKRKPILPMKPSISFNAHYLALPHKNSWNLDLPSSSSRALSSTEFISRYLCTFFVPPIFNKLFIRIWFRWNGIFLITDLWWNHRELLDVATWCDLGREKVNRECFPWSVSGGTCLKIAFDQILISLEITFSRNHFRLALMRFFTELQSSGFSPIDVRHFKNNFQQSDYFWPGQRSETSRGKIFVAFKSIWGLLTSLHRSPEPSKAIKTY